MSNIIQIGGGGGGDLIPLSLTQNGIYNASDYDVDGFDVVNVDVQPNTDEILLTENGVYMASDYNVDGFDKVTVSLARTGGLNAFEFDITFSTYS